MIPLEDLTDDDDDDDDDDDNDDPMILNNRSHVGAYHRPLDGHFYIRLRDLDRKDVFVDICRYLRLAAIPYTSPLLAPNILYWKTSCSSQ